MLERDEGGKKLGGGRWADEEEIVTVEREQHRGGILREALPGSIALRLDAALDVLEEHGLGDEYEQSLRALYEGEVEAKHEARAQAREP